MTNKEQFDTVLLARLQKELAKARVTKSVREKGTKPYVVETKTQEEPMKHPNERERLIRQLNGKPMTSLRHYGDWDKMCQRSSTAVNTNNHALT